MNIVKTIDQYNDDCVYFCDPIKNNIMNEGNFIRILYSTPIFILNGIYISITINQVTIDRYFNKYKCSFDVATHNNLIQRIKTIEANILNKINIKGKHPQYKIYEQISNGNIKIFSDNIDIISNNFLLKIAGIWENDYNYGLTYKFIRL
uniref:Uncharacterized protein n=1 Tax=viral metagenome TaxID=1070528 RepID=A0A6C0I9G0_9ZZZZ